MSSTALAIPEGYTFLDTETLITVKGKKLAKELLEASNKRNPDDFDMYIYNDFFSYGILELIDRTLTSLHAKIVKKDWKEAYPILEALIMFAGFESVWTQCDDGERVRYTFKAVGASFITVMRGLKTAGELDPTHYPSLGCLLENMFDFTNDFKDLSGKYGSICKAIARRVLKEKSDEDYKLDIERLKEWAANLEDEEMKAEIKETIEERVKDLKKERTSRKKIEAWFAKGKAVDEDDNSSDCKMTSVWKKYKAHLSDCPRLPLRGPPEWDLSKWTEEQKKPFSFDSMEDF